MLFWHKEKLTQAVSGTFFKHRITVAAFHTASDKKNTATNHTGNKYTSGIACSNIAVLNDPRQKCGIYCKHFGKHICCYIYGLYQAPNAVSLLKMPKGILLYLGWVALYWPNS